MTLGRHRRCWSADADKRVQIIDPVLLFNLYVARYIYIEVVMMIKAMRRQCTQHGRNGGVWFAIGESISLGGEHHFSLKRVFSSGEQNPAGRRGAQAGTGVRCSEAVDSRLYHAQGQHSV